MENGECLPRSALASCHRLRDRRGVWPRPHERTARDTLRQFCRGELPGSGPLMGSRINRD